MSLNLDLTGTWNPREATFLWEQLRIFPRLSSDHPQDYWVAHAGGACLASYCTLTAARLDTSTGFFRASPVAQQALGPRCILAPPGLPPLLLGAEALLLAASRGWLQGEHWQEPEIAHAALRKNEPWYVLEHASPRLEDALEVWQLPHGGWVNPPRLAELDAQHFRALFAQAAQRRLLR